MFIKLIGLGFKEYISDGMNQFDGMIVLISLVELILATDENANLDGK